MIYFFILAANRQRFMRPEGQQRTMAIALKLWTWSHSGVRIWPQSVALVRRCIGELDAGRRNRLFANLPVGAQKIITTTSLAWLNEIPRAPSTKLRRRRTRTVAGFSYPGLMF